MSTPLVPRRLWCFWWHWGAAKQVSVVCGAGIRLRVWRWDWSVGFEWGKR